MANFIIQGGRKLHGTIKTNTAKNSAVAILCATAMIKGKTVLHDVPRIEEVNRIIEILKSIGLKIRWSGERRLEIMNSGKFTVSRINKESFLRTRSGLLLMGSLCGVLPRFRLPKASGCRLGKRTVNPYLYAMANMGYEAREAGSYFEIFRSKPAGAAFTMYESGDTATENTIMAAVLTPGRTVIKFASSNYMVQDLCRFLVRAGADIQGIGTSTLSITGIPALSPVEGYPIMPDPIETMAFISIAITTGSKLTITDCPIDFLLREIETLKIMGQKFRLSNPRLSEGGSFELTDITVIPSKLSAPPDKIHPLPYPGLNIDNLPLFVPILTQTNGQTLVHDWVYEDRAIYYTELNRLGANIMLHDPHRVTVSGPTPLRRAEIVCPPALRPSINLLIAMLAAPGRSILRNSYPIDRGYENICDRLNSIGAKIDRIE